MKLKLILIITVVLGLQFQAISQRDDEQEIVDDQAGNCANGGLEDNNFSNWTNYYGVNDDGSVPTDDLTVTTSTANHQIVSSGVDNFIPGLSTTCEGNRAIKFGDNADGGTMYASRYEFGVNASNSNFSFCYAMALEDPGHDPPNEQPFFGYVVYTGTSMNINHIVQNYIAGNRWAADIDNPFFEVVNDDWVWRDWSRECIDLSPYIGQTVSVLFVVGGCIYSLHGAYAYVDGLCDDNPEAIADFTMEETFCQNLPVIANGTSSIKEDSHFWSIQESNQQWGTIGPEYTQWYIGQQAGVIDFKQFIEDRGGTLKCNTYYRVKLAVSSECTNWDDQTKLIYISCPDVDAGPDVCCWNPVANLGANIGEPGISYTWDPPVLSIDANGNAEILCSDFAPPNYFPPLIFTATATDAAGCEATDEMIVSFSPPDGQIVFGPDCCTRTLTFQGINYSNLEWSTGSQDQSITITGPGIFSVTAYNACGGKTFTINVTNNDFLDRYYTPLANVNNYDFVSTVSNLNSYNNWHLVHIENPIPQYGHYYATEYKLLIFNRWGQKILEKKDNIDNLGNECIGFDNRAINWDGTINGQKVQQEVYHALLYLKNCQTTDWQLVEVGTPKWVCEETDCKLIPGKGCSFWKHEVCKSYVVQTDYSYAIPITIIW